MRNLHPNATGPDFSDPWLEMELIRETCEAEDAAREACAPYGEVPTRARLEQVRLQLTQVLELQQGRGRHMRMDIVHSLQSKLSEVEARLSSGNPAMSADAVA